uniref:Uncharacterized protein n=1 Tax=Arundo donax TaxID=35708 RepID=A0A0A9A590_ARUDO
MTGNTCSPLVQSQEQLHRISVGKKEGALRQHVHTEYVAKTGAVLRPFLGISPSIIIPWEEETGIEISALALNHSSPRQMIEIEIETVRNVSVAY